MRLKFTYVCLSLLLILFQVSKAMGKPLPEDSLYGVVRVSVCNLHQADKFVSSMTSQALLGMPVRVLGYTGWFKVQTPDNYTGWVHRMSITPMTLQQYNDWNVSPKVVVTALYGVTYSQPDEKSQTVSDVVAGNRLKLEGKKGAFYRVSYPDGRQAYIHKRFAVPENKWRENLKQDPASILRTALSLMGVPYLWAGTSPKGVDCSGFVRTVLLMHDIIIPRDASQQATIGQRIDIEPTLENLWPCDLIFFGRPQTTEHGEEVSHVAFYIGDKRFIHALGDVHINSLDPSQGDYDAFNAGRMLFAVRFLPFLDLDPEINTTRLNPYYHFNQP